MITREVVAAVLAKQIFAAVKEDTDLSQETKLKLTLDKIQDSITSAISGTPEQNQHYGTLTSLIGFKLYNNAAITDITVLKKLSDLIGNAISPILSNKTSITIAQIVSNYKNIHSFLSDVDKAIASKQNILIKATDSVAANIYLIYLQILRIGSLAQTKEPELSILEKTSLCLAKNTSDSSSRILRDGYGKDIDIASNLSKAVKNIMDILSNTQEVRVYRALNCLNEEDIASIYRQNPVNLSQTASNSNPAVIGFIANTGILLGIQFLFQYGISNPAIIFTGNLTATQPMVQAVVSANIAANSGAISLPTYAASIAFSAIAGADILHEMQGGNGIIRKSISGAHSLATKIAPLGDKAADMLSPYLDSFAQTVVTNAKKILGREVGREVKPVDKGIRTKEVGVQTDPYNVVHTNTNFTEANIGKSPASSVFYS